MKIAFDSSPLKTGHSVRGIGYYARNLLAALKGNRDVEIVEDIHQADLYHNTSFSLFAPSKIYKDIATVVTIYDVIPLLYPKAYPLGIKAKINLFRQKRNLKKAVSILTISDTSKRDIVQYLGVPKDKISVIYLAPSSIYQKLETGDWKLEITKRFRLPERFVLYVGDVNYNKNLINLARACKKINTDLVIVGRQAKEEMSSSSHIELQPLKQLIEEFGNDSNILRLGFIEDEELVKIFNLATVYCQPSLYEGFGLPILEAMACGLPIVSSNTPALKEVGQDNVVYFDPTDVHDIANKLKKVLGDKSLQNELSEKGLKHVKNFSWEKVASQTIEEYKNVLKK